MWRGALVEIKFGEDLSESITAISNGERCLSGLRVRHIQQHGIQDKSGSY